MLLNSKLRGSKLEEYPLTLIGVDYNQAAIDVSKQNLTDADVLAKVIWGDISNPKKLADDLERKFQIQLEKLLNVRTFWITTGFGTQTPIYQKITLVNLLAPMLSRANAYQIMPFQHH